MKIAPQTHGNKGGERNQYLYLIKILFSQFQSSELQYEYKLELFTKTEGQSKWTLE